MSNQLTAADCDYIHNVLWEHLLNVRRGYGYGGASEEDYINALFLRLRNLENQINVNPELFNNFD